MYVVASAVRHLSRSATDAELCMLVRCCIPLVAERPILSGSAPPHRIAGVSLPSVYGAYDVHDHVAMRICLCDTVRILPLLALHACSLTHTGVHT